MNRRRQRYVGWLCGGIVLLSAVSAMLVWRMVRQEQLNQALITAIKKRDLRSVSSSLSSGADANTIDFPMDRRPPWRRLIDLFTGRHDPSADRQTALVVALSLSVDHEHPGDDKLIPGIVKLLLDHGADVRGPRGDEALYKAVGEANVNNNVEALRLLLDKGANANLRVEDGHTLLWGEDQKEVIRLLCAHGADPNAGRPLMILAQDSSGEYSGIPALLEYGADPNITDGDGMTPLMWATAYADPDVVKALVAKGAAINAQSKSGKTAISIALHGRIHDGPSQRKIIAILKHAGARE